MAARALSDVLYVVDPATGCWLWQRAKNNDGYGLLRVERRRWLAHRWLYELLREPIPASKELDHVACDNRGCCNPWHVEPRTHAANTRRSKRVRLTLAQIAIARESPLAGAELGRRWGVSGECVNGIRRGRRHAIAGR